MSVPSVSQEALRKGMRLVPSAVTVVTVGGAEPRGITIGSFTSTSLEPPLVSFNVQLGARSHDLLKHADRYAVNVLSEDQAWLSDHFADPSLESEQQFREVAHTSGFGGVPILDEALVTFECTPFARYDAGDHSIFVGRVVSVLEAGPGKAVLYSDRQYRSLGEVLTPRQ